MDENTTPSEVGTLCATLLYGTKEKHKSPVAHGLTSNFPAVSGKARNHLRAGILKLQDRLWLDVKMACEVYWR